jgi:hypothetical protein
MIAVAECEGVRGRVRKEMACATVRERFAELDEAAMAMNGRKKNREITMGRGLITGK